MRMRRNIVMIGLMLAGFGNSLLAQIPEVIPPAFEKTAESAGKTGGNENDSGMDVFDRGAPKQAQVQVEFVEMSHEALTKLLFMAKPGSANAGKLRQQVQDMVVKNEAKVLETQIICAKSGLKATTEAIHETIYPTEYRPPILPSVDPKKPDAAIPVSSGDPMAFETRNVGSTVEIEPTIGEGDDNVDLRFIPELIWRTENTVWHEGKDKAGNPIITEMPNFCVLRLNTQLTCKDGQYTLAGTVSPKDAKGEIDMTRKVMVFVKCDILIVR
jgi:hypothetical protein